MIEALIFALKRLRLFLNEHLQVVFVVQDLLEVFFDRSNKQLILLVTLLHGQVFLLKLVETRLYMRQLAIGLLEQILQLQDLFVSLTFEAFELLDLIITLLEVLEHGSFSFFSSDLFMLQV